MSAAVTIHFRNPDLTVACVDSLLADGWAPILVWDNSADSSVSLQVLENRYASDARVHLVRNSTNLGFGKGLNAALAELGRRAYVGPVLLINNDARVIPGMHDALHAQLQDHAAPALIAPRIVQNEQEQGWLYYQRWLALVTHRSLPGSFAYLSGCCMLVQRTDNSAPLFDEEFFMYGEDVELSWRWRKQGGKLVLLEDAWLEHVGSASSGHASKTYEYFLVNSHWRLAHKLGGNVLQILLMEMLRIPSLGLRACIRALRLRSFVPVQALRQLWGSNF